MPARSHETVGDGKQGASFHVTQAASAANHVPLRSCALAATYITTVLGFVTGHLASAHQGQRRGVAPQTLSGIPAALVDTAARYQTIGEGGLP